MKRCKAVTSRACDSIECCLLDEHEGAHEGQRDSETRAVWTNSNAPEYLPLEAPALDGSRQAHELALRRAEFAPTVTLEEPPAPRTPQTHCHCGALHEQKLDPVLRTIGALPLAAWNETDSEPDQRFAWPQVCRDCGAVYCKIWQPL